MNRKLFSGIKSQCKTKEQRLAFNKLIKTFASVSLADGEDQLITLAQSDDIYTDTEIKNIEKKLNTKRDNIVGICIDNLDYSNFNDVYEVLNKAVSNGDAVPDGSNYGGILISKDKLSKYFK